MLKASKSPYLLKDHSNLLQGQQLSTKEIAHLSNLIIFDSSSSAAGINRYEGIELKDLQIAPKKPRPHATAR